MNYFVVLIILKKNKFVVLMNCETHLAIQFQNVHLISKGKAFIYFWYKQNNKGLM